MEVQLSKPSNTDAVGVENGQHQQGMDIDGGMVWVCVCVCACMCKHAFKLEMLPETFKAT